METGKEFYGVEITYSEDGSRIATNRGGYQPRDLTEAELLPWILLVEKRLENRDNQPCELLASAA
jgi:hypothetical protein